MWGEFRRARAGSEAPPPRAIERGAEQKNFLFLLEEKIGGARKIKNCKESFSARQAPPPRRGGGGGGGGGVFCVTHHLLFSTPRRAPERGVLPRRKTFFTIFDFARATIFFF